MSASESSQHPNLPIFNLIDYYLELETNSYSTPPPTEVSRIVSILQKLNLFSNGTSSSSRDLQGAASVERPSSENLNAQPDELRWTVKTLPLNQLVELPTKEGHSGIFDWLGGHDEGASPKWLWDSEIDATVLATPERLEAGYIAVSYTWGRYQSKVDLQRQFYHTHGTEWQVPTINPDVFPGMLDQMKSVLRHSSLARYFWVDILCIDQLDGGKGDEKDVEIAKQAAIFGRAKGTLAYLWTLDTEDELAHVIASFGDLLLWSLQFCDYSLQKRSELIGYAKLPPHIQSKLNSKLRLDPWFSSLWVLQEMVLSPASIWITRSGSACTVNDSAITTSLVALALEIMEWAYKFRIVLWDQLMHLQNYPNLEPNDRNVYRLKLFSESTMRGEEAQKMWENSTSSADRGRAESRIHDIDTLNVLRDFNNYNLRSLPQSLEGRQSEELKFCGSMKRWIEWGFGEASINLSIQTSRSAIMTAGANRHSTTRRDEALMAALKIPKIPIPADWSTQRTPGGFPHWLQETLFQCSLSEMFYVSHSIRLIGEGYKKTSLLYNEPRFVATNDGSGMVDESWDSSDSTFFTGMLPSTATGHRNSIDFLLKGYAQLPLTGWHLHHDGALHIPHKVPIQKIGPAEIGKIVIEQNGFPWQHGCLIAQAEDKVRDIPEVKHHLGDLAKIIFLPLLFRKNPRQVTEQERVAALQDDLESSPAVLGVVLAGKPSLVATSSMTYWYKVGLYKASGCTLMNLGWQDGILVGSKLAEATVSCRLEDCAQYQYDPLGLGPRISAEA